ncbi:hypothetical protein Pcinc_010796 [Petrolisthes cinctipes]|uniref:Uncharacterized protein n=1 Tax=Petrolisthes cinctipes TaxID=88211 RepID=A0AAE1G227_PETCI|nr:hypothetical protein Pcinc_010796 [Petrolisthes cinctipes]
MYPLTASFAAVGRGRRAITNWKYKNLFVSNIISSIVSSRKRSKNAHDKGSRSSDLLSEGSGTHIRTVLFNCKSSLEDVVENKLFLQQLNFEGDVLGGTLTEGHLAAHNTILDCFPPLSSSCLPSS